ncbi:DNA replication/repair protein RecF [Candidatus Poriferisodalis sp.]|uniref:DNA replication/repair protein RecF n=1 Tax=Candidatus Poriferisodalis sp. TaxID=3101277 RepID=UPI003B016A53
MIIAWLSVENFRNHRSTEISFDPGRTLVVGPNGHGKTNLLEAVAMLDGSGSFRGATAETLVRAGSQRAYVRAEIQRRNRSSLVEMEIPAGGRSRAQVNGERARSLRDLAEIVTAVVFCPADLAIAAGGPSMRRSLLDEVLASTDREFRAARADLERILRQRNNLLKQAGQRPDSDALNTLDVWDHQFATAGETVVRCRAELVEALAPVAQEAYRQLAGTDASLELVYVTSWADMSLAAAVAGARSDDLRRGTTSVGPHRDEMEITLEGLAARTHASQGEQRSIALSLRLAQHHYIADRVGTAPIVLLDDVFSELDEGRARRLVGCLPGAQTVVTSATGHVPDGIDIDSRIEVHDGEVISASVCHDEPRHPDE